MWTRSSWFCACLPLETAERIFDLPARFGPRNDQRQPRRTAVVSIQVHGMFEPGHTVVALADQLGGAQDAVLPVDTGIFLARAVRFPDGDAGIRRGSGEIENCAGGPGL